MIVVGVVGYVHTPRGLRTLNTVWAGAPHCRPFHLAGQCFLRLSLLHV